MLVCGAMTKNLLALLTLCLAMCLLPARADVLPLLAQAQAINANGYLQRLNDPLGELSPEQALAAPNWHALPASLSGGYTFSTLWLKVQVAAPGNDQQQWAMRLSNALLDDVRLYQRGADGRWSERRAGENLPRDQWPVDYRAAVFPLQLQGPEPTLLLLRLQSKNALSVSVDFSPRASFAAASRHEYLLYGLYFGIYLLLIGFHVFFWRMTAAPNSGWYLVYVSCCVLIEALSIGLPQQLLNIPVAISDPLLGVALALGIPIGMIFAGRQLGLPQVYPRLQRALAAACWLIGGGAALVVLAGYYQLAMPVVQATALVLVPSLISLAVFLLLCGHRPARFYLLVFGIYYAGVIISFLRNFGYLPAAFWTEHAVAVGTLLHMALMSLRIISHYNRLKRDKERAQAINAMMVQQQKAQLESLVAIRTAELREEIERRAQLELELRLALEQEQRMRAEQFDFVAMVSHEFRTPLAIINTSAQQLGKHLDAPVEKSLRRCQNIRDAGSRLLALVDDYLTLDRIADIHPTSRFVVSDVLSVLETMVADFEPGRILLDCRVPTRRYCCDAGLLRVAVRNLLANADRHAPSGAPIRVELRAQEEGLQLQIRHPAELIAADERERLFHKYYRGRQAQQSAGAGLGLYMVQRIAHLHGGELQLLSHGGDEDVCFSLRLRLVRGDSSDLAGLSLDPVSPDATYGVDNRTALYPGA